MQQRMLCEQTDDKPAEPEDDWSRFGLRREGDRLVGSDADLDRYIAHRQAKEST